MLIGGIFHVWLRNNHDYDICTIPRLHCTSGILKMPKLSLFQWGIFDGFWLIFQVKIWLKVHSKEFESISVWYSHSHDVRMSNYHWYSKISIFSLTKMSILINSSNSSYSHFVTSSSSRNHICLPQLWKKFPLPIYCHKISFIPISPLLICFDVNSLEEYHYRAHVWLNRCTT